MTLKELAIKLDNLINDAVTRPIMGQVAGEAKGLIQSRTRQGFGVSKNKGRKEKLDPLKTSTIRRRKYAARRGELSPKTSPDKSNMTRTGQLIDTLNTESDSKSARVFVDGSKNIKKVRDNENRPFMNISKSEFNKIVDLVETEIQKSIDKKGL